MDFTALKTAIQNAIKLNGNEEITGDILQGVLLSMVSTLGDSAINDLVTAISNEATARQNGDSTLNGYIEALQGAVNSINTAIGNGFVYAGIATPATTPATGKVFYLALNAGTYTNFGNIEVSQGINILKYNGSTWSLDAFIGIDDAPTPSSNNLVKSGGVFDKVMADGSAFDISAHFASGGTLATYADLSAALTALNTLSAAYKKGGMSIKFVQSSDNKYVQYRLMSDTFNTTPSNWQGVDDEPTAGSDNLVKSGGVALIQLELSGLSGNHNYISELISNCAVWGTETIYLHQWSTTSVIVIPINSTDYVIVSDEAPTQYGYFSGYPVKEDSTYGISKSSSKELPAGTKFVALQFNNSSLPTYLYVKQNNQYLSIGDSKDLQYKIEKEVIDSASRIEETDFSIYKIANTGIGDNGEFVTLSGVQIIPIEYLGRGIDVETDFNIAYWCFYSQFTDGNGLGYISRQVISSYVRKPTIPSTTKYIYFVVNGNGTYFNVSQNGTFEEKTGSTESILRGSSAKASYHGEEAFTLDGIYKTDGTIYGEAYWLHTPYINISEGDYVNARLISGSADLCAIAFFDANNNILDYVLTVDSTANYTRCYNAVAPAGVAYVSFGCFKSKVSDCSFCIYKSAQKSADSFKNTVLGFIGDSITYGYDDSADGVYNVNLGIAPQLYRPWPYNVAAKLNAKKVYNYGVSSATLIPASDSIKGWAADYVDCADEVDIMAVMIGINDALHNTMTPALYPLGEMSDRTTDTFYGSLHVLWNGLLSKYPPKNGKKLFCIMYPDFDNAPYWSSFKEAVYEVTEYYGIPICELNKELGISQNGDPSFQYWFRSGNNHSAHPSQNGADLFASVISNFINSHFAK